MMMNKRTRKHKAKTDLTSRDLEEGTHEPLIRDENPQPAKKRRYIQTVTELATTSNATALPLHSEPKTQGRAKPQSGGYDAEMTKKPGRPLGRTAQMGTKKAGNSTKQVLKRPLAGGSEAPKSKKRKPAGKQTGAAQPPLAPAGGGTATTVLESELNSEEALRLEKAARKEAERKAQQRKLTPQHMLEDGGFVEVQCQLCNKSGREIELMYKTEPGKADLSWGKMSPDNAWSFNSYQGHTWYSRDPETQKVLQTIVIGKPAKYCFLPSDQVRKINSRWEKKKRRFEQSYLHTKGIHWLNVYPRELKIQHFMYLPRAVGVSYSVESSALHLRNEEDRDRATQSPVELENTVVNHPLSLTLETKSIAPRVYVVHNFCSRFECEEIIRTANPFLKPSSVSNVEMQNIKHRNSATAWLKTCENTVTDRIFSRVADLCRLKRELVRKHVVSEYMQVVRYKPGQYYHEHHDYMDPALYPASQEVQRGHNRYCTVMIYLRAPQGKGLAGGGHTYFPDASTDLVAGHEKRRRRELDLPDDNAFSDRPRGLKIRPKVGTAVMFYSMLPDGNLDELSLHAGQPVQRGEKWIANVFLWDPSWQ